MNKKAVAAMKDFLEALGIDLEASGMKKTPERVAQLYEYLFQGRTIDPAEVWGEIFPTEYNGLVMVKNIPFYTMCEHHLVPFFGKAHIVYAPHNGQVAGFSKLAKIVEVMSRRPQLQERMTKQIADAIESGLQAEGVMIVLESEQLCMTMRGEMAQGTKTITSESRGVLYTKTELRQQALTFLRMGGDGNDPTCAVL